MQLAATGLAELVRVVEGIEGREAAQTALAALESRPALEIEFAFCVAGTRVCLRLDASTTTVHNLLGVCTTYESRRPQYVETLAWRMGEVTFDYDLSELTEFDDRYTFVPRFYDGAKCAPQKGDVYVVPQGRNRGKYRVCMRTDDGACFDAYKIGTVTEGIDALVAVKERSFYAPREADEGIKFGFAAPLYRLIQTALYKCRTVTADELYAVYCATPVQGAMTHAQFRHALLLCSPWDGPATLHVYGYRGRNERWQALDRPTNPVYNTMPVYCP